MPEQSKRADVPGPAGGARDAGSGPPPPDPLSAMTPRFNLLFRTFARRFFRHFDLDAPTLARLRALGERGSAV